MAGHTYKPGNITGSLADDYSQLVRGKLSIEAIKAKVCVATTPPAIRARLVAQRVHISRLAAVMRL